MLSFIVAIALFSGHADAPTRGVEEVYTKAPNVVTIPTVVISTPRHAHTVAFTVRETTVIATWKCGAPRPLANDSTMTVKECKYVVR